MSFLSPCSAYSAAASFYVILRGSVDMYHHAAGAGDADVFLARLSTGECVGELGSVFGGIRPTSAVVSSPGSQLLQIDYAGMVPPDSLVYLCVSLFRLRGLWRAVYDVVVAPSFRSASAALDQRVAFLRRMHLFTNWPQQEMYLLASWLTQEDHHSVSVCFVSVTCGGVRWCPCVMLRFACVIGFMCVQGDVLFNEGEPAIKAFIVVEGTVDIRRNEASLSPSPIVVQTVFPPGIFITSDIISQTQNRSVSAAYLPLSLLTYLSVVARVGERGVHQ